MSGTCSWTSYPKIWNMGHRMIKDLFLDSVIIEEKVDGSQFSFGIFNGEIKVRSKGADIYMDAPPTMFKAACETVAFLAPMLHEGWTYRAEYLSRPKHNVLAYDRVPNANLIIFDIAVGSEDYLSRHDKEQEAARLKLEVVPVLFAGKLVGFEQFMHLLNTTSILGGQKIEGVVIKNYGRFGIDGKPLMAKHVSEDFKEVHKGEWKSANPTNKDILVALTAALRTPARFAKAVQHLTEAGVLTDSPKDIGPLIKELQTDIEGEMKQEVMEKLYAWAWPHIRRGIVSGFPEWYKQQLLAKQFAPSIDIEVSNWGLGPDGSATGTDTIVIPTEQQ